MGIPGNERADFLAKEATDKEPELSVQLPFIDLEESARSAAYSDLYSRLVDDGIYKGKAYSSAYLNIFYGLDLDSKSIVQVSCGTLQLGFVSLYEVNIVDNPPCPCGNGEEDLQHVLW